MQSHHYQFSGKNLAALCLPPLLPLVLCAVLLRLAAWGGLLPPPRQGLDLDRTILIHQAEASRNARGAEILFLGDSSCLMNISAPQAAQELGRRTLNLGTLSYLGLSDHALLLRRYSQANASRPPAAVVLLLHPQALRRHFPRRFHSEFLASVDEGIDHAEAAGLGERLTRLLGLELLRNRVLSRLLPTPLPGLYGSVYGFTSDLDRYMTRHGGSLLDPVRIPISGSAEYSLAPPLQAASRSFREAVPPSARLFIGITPIPQSHALPGYSEQYAQMLRTWAGWIQADAPLSGLPPTLPDHFFNSVTHLTPSGVSNYTQQVVGQLAPLLK